MSYMAELLDIASGNPGAITVLSEISTMMPITDLISKLQRDNLKGPLIWLCYKDLLGLDFKGSRTKALTELIRNDKLMDAIKKKTETDEKFKYDWEWHLREMNKRR